MSDVTQATKAIEAKITDQIGNPQRHWEMKRDSLFVAQEALGRVDDALVGITVVLEAEGKAANPDSLRSAKAEAREAWHRAISDFQGKRVMALVV